MKLRQAKAERAKARGKEVADAAKQAVEEARLRAKEEAQRKQYRTSKAAFTRLRWCTSWEAALMELLSNEAGLRAFRTWLLAEGLTNDVTHLDLLTCTAEFDQLRLPEQGRPWQPERYFLSLEGFE